MGSLDVQTVRITYNGSEVRNRLARGLIVVGAAIGVTLVFLATPLMIAAHPLFRLFCLQHLACRSLKVTSPSAPLRVRLYDWHTHRFQQRWLRNLAASGRPSRNAILAADAAQS